MFNILSLIELLSHYSSPPSSLDLFKGPTYHSPIITFSNLYFYFYKLMSFTFRTITLSPIVAMYFIKSIRYFLFVST
jgi:hypothetical protein